jgi:hypothetical protein
MSRAQPVLSRRDLLRLATAAGGASILGASVVGASVLGGCTDDDAVDSGATGHTHLVVLTTKDGVSVVDQDGRVVTPATVVATARPDWSQVVTAQADGEDTRVVVTDLASRRVLSSEVLRGRLEPRIVSPTRDLIASVPPGGAGIYGLHQPGGRDRTTIVVSGPDGERTRMELAGNIEPEAFDPTGGLLFVFDYVPAGQPERFRLRAIDLATRQLTPLITRTKDPILIGTEEQIRAHRIESVYDPRREMVYAIYSSEPDAIAFVHCVHLVERWWHRVDLPAPFGVERPGVHAIALSPSGDRLSVVHAPSGSVADIDPDELAVRRVSAFAGTGQLGKPNAVISPEGRLIVNVDRKVIAADPYQEIATPGEARGLALSDGDDIWVGNPDGVVRYDLGSAEEIGRFGVPGLFTIKHVRTLTA